MKIDKVNIFWYFCSEILFFPEQFPDNPHRKGDCMSHYQRYAPPLGSMQLIVWMATFIILPFFLAQAGLVFAVLTFAFILGIQPHIKQLSEEGHKIRFTLKSAKIFGKTLWEKKVFTLFTVHIENKKRSNAVATILVLIFTFLFLPGVFYIVWKASALFVERIDARWETIDAGITQLFDYARDVAPAYVPEGDTNVLFGGFFVEIFGDLKSFVTGLSTKAAGVLGHIVKAWFEIIISMILLGVLIQNWDKEIKNVKWRIQHGLTDQTLVKRIFRSVELYRDNLSVLLVGYLEVAFALSIYYFLMMTFLPLNLGIGFIVVTSLFFGFATAIPKIGGIAVKIISPIIMILYFQEGFGWFGLGAETMTISLGVDLIIKAFIMFLIAFLGGYLEAYEYTPEIIGKKLEMTKMEIVMTVLIWAIGAKFFGMIFGFLLMLLIPTFTKLYKEEMGEEAEEGAVTGELPLFKSRNGGDGTEEGQQETA